MNILRGQVYYADLSAVKGSEQGGFRPVVIVQNDMGNKYSPTTIAVPMTTRPTKKEIPTHVKINVKGIDNIILCEQVRTIDKSRLKGEPVATLDAATMQQVSKAMKISLSI